MAYRVQALPGYLRDEDDEFDCTYATIYFAAPAEWEGLIATLARTGEAPNERWLRVIDEMNAAPDLDTLNAILARERCREETP